MRYILFFAPYLLLATYYLLLATCYLLLGVPHLDEICCSILGISHHSQQEPEPSAINNDAKMIFIDLEGTLIRLFLHL